MHIFMDLPRMTPIMSGCGMADLMCRDCSYNALKQSRKYTVQVTIIYTRKVQAH